MAEVRPGGPHMRGTVQERGTAEFRWPLHPASVRLSRTAVLAMCALWRTSEVCHAAALAVSELIGNSVRAGQGDQVLLRLSWTPRRLRVEVHDDAPGLPRLTEADPLAESGRGLALAEAVVDRLDYERAGAQNQWVLERLRH